jgi:predicted metal-dependent peptidase
MSSIEKFTKADNISRDVLQLSRNILLVNLRFLDVAFSQLKPIPILETTMFTDGKHLGYGPRFVLKRYISEKEAVVRDYLHVLLHCIYRHMYIHTLINQPCWDLASDIAVEYTISNIGLNATLASRQTRQVDTIKLLKENMDALTAEKIYRHYLELNLTEEQIRKIRMDFMADDHTVWYRPPSKDTSPKDNSSSNEGEANKQDRTSTGLSNYSPNIEAEWKAISNSIQQDLTTFSMKKGNKAGNMVQNLAEINREKYDYISFLKKFAVISETMQINDDEFDYIYYSYGLKLYDKTPLIEPLEYKEVKRIKEFIIAIDTSASTSGELVKAFMRKTYNILKTTESFFHKKNVHIIQCDADIQEHVKVTSEKELDAYLSNLSIHGGGGTDFRPVFELVDSLLHNNEFTDLKGLIYFTDGYGTFPVKKPKYETAFVFLSENSDHNIIVPPWAIKLILRSDEI